METKRNSYMDVSLTLRSKKVEKLVYFLRNCNKHIILYFPDLSLISESMKLFEFNY